MPLAGALWPFLLNGLALLLVALVPAFALSLIVDYTPTKAVLLVCCASTTIAGSLVRPQRSLTGETSSIGPAGRAVLLGAVSGLVMVSQTPIVDNLPIIFRLMVAVAILGFVVERATCLLAAVAGSERGAPLIAVAGLGLAGSAPIWLGPWAEYLGTYEQASNAIIWLSPLTFLAVMADYDYLRNHWFYIYTPFGGLRYAYPGKVTYCTIYLLLGGLLWLAEHRAILAKATNANAE